MAGDRNGRITMMILDSAITTASAVIFLYQEKISKRTGSVAHASATHSFECARPLFYLKKEAV